MKKSVVSLLLFILGLTFSFADAWASPDFKQYRPNLWDIYVQSQYFQTFGNYSASGNAYSSLPSGYSYDAIDTNAEVRKAWAPNSAWWLGTEFNYGRSTRPGEDKTNSGFSRLNMGADILVELENYNLIPELSFTYPLIKNDFSGDAISLSEGVMEMQGRIIAQTQWGKIRGQTYLGYTYRDQGRSGLLPYGIIAEWAGSSISTSAGIKGYTSIGSDKDSSSSAQRLAYSALNNGSSLRYTSINPALLEAEAKINFMANQKLGITFGAAMGLNGANQAAAYRLFAGVSYGLEFNKSRPEPRKQVVVPPEERFIPNTGEEAEDSNFIAPVPEPVPVPVAPPPPKKKIKKKKTLQQELDETEMRIELKPKKKNKKKAK